MLRILIDLRMVREGLHGIARYALELARRLPQLEPTWQFYGLTGPHGIPEGLGDLAPRIPLVRCAAEFLSPFEQPALTAALLRHQPSLFHATSFSLPALWSGHLVATIHDANHLALADHASLSHVAYYRLIVAPRAKKASALITVSDFSRNELVAHLGLAAADIEVIYNGVDTAFHTTTAETLAAFRARRLLPDRYFGAVGNIKRHKNLGVLKSIAEKLPAPLVLLAGRGAKRALNFSDSVIELSPLSDADLALFYAGATAIFVPSLYEGFGLPALEAMSCGAAVIAARAGAHPEILKDAAMLVSANDSDEWLHAAVDLFNDEVERARLEDRGRSRAAQFSWDDCAKKTLAVYRRALGRQ